MITVRDTYLKEPPADMDHSRAIVLKARNPVDGSEVLLCRYSIRHDPEQVELYGDWEVLKEFCDTEDITPEL